jgi:hypothetical protein
MTHTCPVCGKKNIWSVMKIVVTSGYFLPAMNIGEVTGQASGLPRKAIVSISSEA